MNTMATQYTDLEVALNTLVTNFHSASATNADTLTVQEFQSMLSQELPNMVKTAGDQEGLNKLLEDMGVEEGKGVTFKDFWRLVDSLANTQCGLQSKEKHSWDTSIQSLLFPISFCNIVPSTLMVFGVFTKV